MPKSQKDEAVALLQPAAANHVLNDEVKTFPVASTSSVLLVNVFVELSVATATPFTVAAVVTAKFVAVSVEPENVKSESSVNNPFVVAIVTRPEVNALKVAVITFAVLTHCRIPEPAAAG